MSHIVSVLPPPVGPLSRGLDADGPESPGQRGAAFDEDESFSQGLRSRWRGLLDDLRRPEERQALFSILVMAGGLVFSYWPGLLNAKSSWNNAQYSHGWLVPLFSAAILFWWRRPIAKVAWSARLAGTLLLVASVGVRLLVARYRIITIDMYTFVPALAGVVLMGGGWGMARWALGPVAFLIFMYPLPDEATRYLLGPLQTLATTVSTFAIQTCGVDAIREGNKIIVGERHLGVVDACSGLRMLTIFIALSVAIVMTGEHDWLDGIVIVLSSIPIALFVNAVRITSTGLMYTVDAELADKLFHDWAGYFMMPMALGLLFTEQRLLSHLRVQIDEDRGPTPVNVAVASSPRDGGGGVLARVGRLLAAGRRERAVDLVRLVEIQPERSVVASSTGTPRGPRVRGAPDGASPPPVVACEVSASAAGGRASVSGPPPIISPSILASSSR